MRFSKIRFGLLFLSFWAIPSHANSDARTIMEWAIISADNDRAAPFNWSATKATDVCLALEELAMCGSKREWLTLAKQTKKRSFKPDGSLNSVTGRCPTTSLERNNLISSTPDPSSHCNNPFFSVSAIRQKRTVYTSSHATSSPPSHTNPASATQSSYSQNSPPSGYSAPSYQSKRWLEETYNIDLLQIKTKVRKGFCASGSEAVISLTGMIGPDSSFAMNKLLEGLESCRDAKGEVVKQVEMHISSGGGFLHDGYNLGKTLEKFNVRAVINDDEVCASSCAVAFLGASNRVVEDKGQIMFHAPYFSGKNEYGEKDIDCDVGEESLDELKDYYVSMTDKETGERLFERTMWYCSADDGWVVTGGAAAELYGIATER